MTTGVGDTTGLAAVHRTEVDGVPTFWVDTGRPTLAAVLVFRSGIVDETLPTTGWTHLVEHLALHGWDRGGLQVNGSVSLLSTELTAHGEPEEVVRFLDGVTRWLRAPDLSRLEHESKVLRAEAEYRGAGDAAEAMLQRYGARHAGLAGYTEPGLGRATPERLAAFTEGTVGLGRSALVLDGAPPPGLRLHLPPGPARPVPEPPEAADERPAAYATPGRLVLSGEVPRSSAATVLPGVLQDMLRRDLRDTAGGAYAPWSSYEAVGPGSGVVLAGSDVSADLLPTVVHYALSGLAALRERGPLDGVVDDLVQGTVRAMRDPYAALGLARRAAQEHLEDLPRQSPEELVADMATVSADDVHALVDRVAETLLLGVPGSATWADELPVLRMPTSSAPVEGRRFRSRDTPADRSVLVLGSEGISVGTGDEWRTLRLENLAGVLRFPDGARHLVGTDGYGLTIEPTMVRRGEDASGLVDELVRADLVLPMTPRPDGAVPRPLPLRRRWGSWLAAHGTAVRVVLLVTIALALVVVAPRMLLPFVGGGLAAAWWEWRRARPKDGST